MHNIPGAFCRKLFKLAPGINTSMARKPYRVELIYTKTGKKQYFITKDVKVGKRRQKIRKFICSGDISPSASQAQEFYEQHAYEIELRAAKKRATLSSSQYSSAYLSREQISTIEEIRSIYKSLKELLTVNELGVYEEKFEVSYIQGTVFIEGNTMSLTDAYNLYVQGISPNDKTLREINEVQNFKKVVAYRNSYRGKVTLDFIKNLHSFIMSNIDEHSAGAFRRIDDIMIAGCELRLCPSELIEHELGEAINRYYRHLDSDHHPFEEAVLFHHQFETIHPFADGNGRVGREIFNYMLMKEKYPRLLFMGENKQNYHKALSLGDEDKFADMIAIFAEIISDQRYDILQKNLMKLLQKAPKDVISPVKRTEQVKLSDFIQI
jgi:fido (protein-threonine AMPylation protein)